MIKQPPHLKKGDKIALVSPAKKLPGDIDFALGVFKQWGLEVVIGESVYASHHQFAGPDELRAQDLQHFLDDPSIKAIVAARGGYGVIRIIDQLDFSKFKQQPKWLVGFSDITVLLSHVMANLQVQSIHGQMPYTFKESTPEALESLRKALFGEPLEYRYKSTFPNREGTAEGILIGGNLTLLVMVQGSVSEMDYTDKILFIEDVAESPSSVDRMMRMLKRAGKLSSLKGLIVGAFNELPEEKIPFGQSPEEVILEIVKAYDYPVCFNFPLGHIEDNKAIVLGKQAKLNITGSAAELLYK
ncbi:S66 peptidase family protein [Pedobacter nutrimenti]|uniref:Muramoyltetrapeptide carboxypeptidase n=1 Tax=Pedobacter nutrimenti TaxID=1241337 RepID=A0A318UK60_9SPHI|nr:LD-carboxypeptidase [Pedobacter nutrimenti]PYF75870.1 muramoyltetrapeptide carboxypeptidase [Pedobacter nutrimenti]